MKGSIVLVLAVVVAIAVAAANAGGRAEHLALKPNGTGVSASADLSQRGVDVTVRKLPEGAAVVAAIGLYSCSGGTHTAVAYADAGGTARWRARLPLSWAQLHDGRHVIALESDGRTIACAAIPASHPKLRRWGIWSFALRFTD